MENSENQKQIRLNHGLSRSQFIIIASGAGVSFLIEPLINKLGNGTRWFNNPRYLQNKKSLRFDIAPGLYKVKHKASPIYYFRNNKAGVLKNVAEPWRFQSNLRAVTEEELWKRRDWMLRLHQQELVQYLASKPQDAALLRKLNVYVQLQNEPFLPQFIDLYTKVSFQNKPARLLAAHQKIQIAVNKFSSNLSLLLPLKYQHEPPKNQLKKWAETRQKLLEENINNRIARWQQRLA